jgi:uncharacterized membrane protein YgcG
MPELCGYVGDWCPGLQKIGGKGVAQVLQTEPGAAWPSGVLDSERKIHGEASRSATSASASHRACHSESASVSLTVRSTVRVLPVLVSFTCPAETARSMRRVRAAASKSCHLSARPSWTPACIGHLARGLCPTHGSRGSGSSGREGCGASEGGAGCGGRCVLGGSDESVGVTVCRA